VSARTNTRSKNNSRNVARCGAWGFRSSAAAPLVVIALPFCRMRRRQRQSYHRHPGVGADKRQCGRSRPQTGLGQQVATRQPALLGVHDV
jgi:hypothetical protein